MNEELILRALWAAGIIGTGLAGYWAINRTLLSRVRHKTLGLESMRAGVPAILYFTTPTCAPCRTVQGPALKRVQEQMGDGVQIIKVDAASRPEVADHWGVLSVPTTFVIDSAGKPRRVNHGVTQSEKIIYQINEVSRK
jgi:thioredoxin 1